MARAAAIAAYQARVDGVDTTAPLSSADELASACPRGTQAWDRGVDYGTMCAPLCTSDAECDSGERCRFLPPQPQLGDRSVFADEMQDVFLEAAAMDAAIAENPIYDEPAVCDGECPDEPELYEVRPYSPLALCDPLWDVDG